MGAAAALVALRTDASTPEALDAVQRFGKRLAMHVVAAKPRFLSPATVPESVIAYERDIIRTQSLGSGKPENIIAKMTEGRIRKFLSEISLLDQPHMIEEGNPRVSDLAGKVAKEAKCVLEVVGFVRYRCGEADELSTSA